MSQYDIPNPVSIEGKGNVGAGREIEEYAGRVRGAALFDDEDEDGG
jgi:hypothetical protein